MKIKVRLSDAGLRDAERQIQEYKTTLNKKAQEFAKALADKGLDVAKVRFANAEYAGSNDVSCRVEQNGNTCTIIAEGKSVAFIEFGTGVRFREYGKADYTPPAHGTYGKGKGKNPHGWYFKQSEGAAARHTYGNPPAEVMLTARDAMVERVVQIAREVWK